MPETIAITLSNSWFGTWVFDYCEAPVEIKTIYDVIGCFHHGLYGR